METFIMFKNLMGNVFPADWMILNLHQMKVFLRAIDQYSDVLNKFFLDSTYFHLQVSLTRNVKGFQVQSSSSTSTIKFKFNNYASGKADIILPETLSYFYIAQAIMP